jgi:hypothetical protein
MEQRLNIINICIFTDNLYIDHMKSFILTHFLLFYYLLITTTKEIFFSVTSFRMSTAIKNKVEVAELIRDDYSKQLIKTKTKLIERILFHDKNIGIESGIINTTTTTNDKMTIPKSTLSKFLKDFSLPTVKNYLRDLKKHEHQTFENKEKVNVVNVLGHQKI